MDDKPIRSSENNRASSKVSISKVPDQVQKDTTNLRKSSQVRKQNRKYCDVASIVKNPFNDL